MKNKLFGYIFLSIISISCGLKKLPLSEFNTFNASTLNGTYYNGDNKLSNLFYLFYTDAWGRFKHLSDFITIEYNPANNKTLKVSYYDDDGVLQHKYYKGKFKDKFFQIYLSNKRMYIPFFAGEYVDRIRVGLDKDCDLLIHHQFSNFGWFLMFLNGFMDSKSYSFLKFDISKSPFPVPYVENEKWGFIDSTKNIIIEPEYEYVRLFERDVARVKQNGKWGLINKKGEKITETKYDKIYSFNENYGVNKDLLMRVVLNNKIGYIDTCGNEIIPPEYDEIRYPYRSIKDYKNEYGWIERYPAYFDAYGITRKGNKYGYVAKEGIVFPPVFDQVSSYFSIHPCFFLQTHKVLYSKVIYKGEEYLLNLEGIMYKYKCTIKDLKVFEETKIKVSDLEEY